MAAFAHSTPAAAPARAIRRRFALGCALLLGLAMFGAAAAEEGRLVPAAAADPTPASGPAQTLVVSGGCFWGVQAVFQHVKGVEAAVSGYAGGGAAMAQYESVSTGRTGHAESVRITYDPRAVTAGQLLRVFFSVVHDPTQRDRQGPDEGPQYRSAVFYADENQKKLAEAYIAQLDEARAFSRPVATRVEPLTGFYPAEAYHQDYLALHPGNPYIVFNDKPKVENLKRLFPALYSDKPRLVSEAKSPL
jgi:peptide-methionine (S)-S-oxide reductase